VTEYRRGMMMQPIPQAAPYFGAAVSDGIPIVEPVVAPCDLSLLGLVEVLLKEPRRLDDLNRAEARQAELMPRLLAISLTSFALFGVALSLILHFTPPAAYPHRLLPIPRVYLGGSALALVGAYSLGLVAATGLCLPSFYFFALLAGVKMRLSQIVSQVMCSKATTAVVLVGILPIYVAVVLGMVVFEADAPLLETCLYLGLALPFVA